MQEVGIEGISNQKAHIANEKSIGYNSLRKTMMESPSYKDYSTHVEGVGMATPECTYGTSPNRVEVNQMSNI